MGFVCMFLGGFVLWWGFLFYIFFKPKFFTTKNLVITYKLNTIEGFYHKERKFSTILVFFMVFVTILENNKTRRRNRIQKMHYKCEHVNT